MFSIHYLLTVLRSLSFFIQFEVNDQHHQDYLRFKSDNSSANLFRDGDVMVLLIASNESYAMYNHTLRYQQKLCMFKWIGTHPTVDGLAMTLAESNGTIASYFYDTFSFYSINYIEHVNNVLYVDCPEQIISCKDVNYGLFVAIVFSIGLLLRSDKLLQLGSRMIISRKNISSNAV